MPEPRRHAATADPRSPAVLVLGAHGRLGDTVARALAADHRIVTLPPGALAGAQAEAALDEAMRTRPCAIVNCAALSDVDAAERDPAAAMRANAQLPETLARLAARHDCLLVHFSTDYVFDGLAQRPYRPEDPTTPIQVYGRSKLAGEQAIVAQGCSHWILRVSWLYGSPARNLLAELLAPGSELRTFRIAADRIGVPNPTWMIASQLARALRRSRAAPPPGAPAHSGTHHLVCRGETTWYDFAIAAVQYATGLGLLRVGATPTLVPVAERDNPRPATRPDYCTLDNSSFERAFAVTLPDWRTALHSTLDARASGTALECSDPS